MAIYTFESPYSAIRLADQLVAVDTSYLIPLADTNHSFHASVFGFHAAARAKRVLFACDPVARQEFVKWVRRDVLIQAIIAASGANGALEARYRAAASMPHAAFSRATLESRFEKIIKDHIRRDDIGILLEYTPVQIWDEVRRLEHDSDIVPGDVDTLNWDEVERLMALTGMACADSMIAQHTLHVQAEAIVTGDADFVGLHSIVSIYMPYAAASACSSYDPAVDAAT